MTMTTTPQPTATATTCPNGHTGPFRYIEQIVAWREVITASDEELIVSGRYQSGEGYDDGVEGTAELECHHYDDDGTPASFCGETFPLPRPVSDWR